MTALEKLQDALDKGGKVKGYREPRYDASGKLEGYARQLIQVQCGDIIEACALVADLDEIVVILERGSRTVATERSPENLVTVQADDLFHLLEKARPAKAV